ncbi:arsenate reductase [Catalinimonas alkaloidigena]|uniref:Arsenate reductase n=1 Tax=Catalinimonas alkaloidigena TaxID=1075417 RepID=A0A1G9ALE4_9BACT|nr:hypothetical protein [Catalinimonas alkaloidigena]SDK27335.1 arsenate reductase [Catalinimonas alkaloidigena]
MKRILIVGTHDATRSQMMHGYLRAYAPNLAEVATAGLDVRRINPRALAAMQVDGVNISEQSTTPLSAYQGQKFDYLITVSQEAFDRLPQSSAKTEFIHCPLPDPSDHEGAEVDEATLEREYEALRNEIKAFVIEFVDMYLRQSVNQAM